MKTTILVDNEAQDGLGCEWGFAALIETSQTTILLDSGASPLFMSNADDLGIDLSLIDYAVLSHAHYDHADGFGAFLKSNTDARLLLRSFCEENCWSDAKGEMTYIGIQRGLMDKHEDRLQLIEEITEFAPGAWLIPHSTNGLDEIGEREHLYLKDEQGNLVADSFDHEQTLVIDTPQGLVVFNSCSHGGVDVIINEVQAALPNKQIIAYVGGLHLFLQNNEFVHDLADRIRKLGIKKIYTGHCTGEAAFNILQEELGDVVEATYAGKVFEF